WQTDRTPFSRQVLFLPQDVVRKRGSPYRVWRGRMRLSGMLCPQVALEGRVEFAQVVPQTDPVAEITRPERVRESPRILGDSSQVFVKGVPRARRAGRVRPEEGM